MTKLIQYCDLKKRILRDKVAAVIERRNIKTGVVRVPIRPQVDSFHSGGLVFQEKNKAYVARFYSIQLATDPIRGEFINF